MKIKYLTGAMALAMGLSGGAYAGLSFDPDGAPGGSPVIDVGAFDWSPSGLFALGGQQAITNWLADPTCPNNSCDFQLYSHATMATSYVDGNGVQKNIAGLGTNFELTAIAGFTETVTGVIAGAGIATFATVPSAPGFLQMYYDTSIDANNLTGSGFNDGDLILSLTRVGAASGIFQVTDSTPVPLDGTANGDQYLNGAIPRTQDTVTGLGSNTNVPFYVDDLVNQVDHAFFLGNLVSLGIQFSNISQGLPYVSADPSDCYTVAASGIAVPGNGTQASYACDGAHTADWMAVQTALAGGAVPQIGPVNGLLPAGFRDFVAQTDYNSPVTARAIPEPTSLALLGMGLGAFGLAGIRRRREGLQA